MIIYDGAIAPGRYPSFPKQNSAGGRLRDLSNESRIICRVDSRVVSINFRRDSKEQSASSVTAFSGYFFFLLLWTDKALLRRPSFEKTSFNGH